MSNAEKARVSAIKGLLNRAVARLSGMTDPDPAAAAALVDVNAALAEAEALCPTCDPTEPPQ
ncbi:MAG TPA: hypothetical protein VK002_15360 [Rubricoccaceae bacterium]|nr:hypothetical protein [Rubricoccaceae bacterium]